MKNQKINQFVQVFVLLLASTIVVQAQDKPSAKKETVPTDAQTSNVQNASDNSSAEIKIIEKAYKKMTIAHVGSRLSEAKRRGQNYNFEKTLKFKLKDFHVGPIREIENKRYRDLVTPPSGEIIQIGTVTTINGNTDKNGVVTKDEARFSIDAKWVNGQYSSGADGNWTVGDILQLEPMRFHDVGKYASFKVEVSLDGRSKAYNALVMFHNPYQTQPLEALEPDFLDSVVGIGGVITQVFKENKMPLFTKIVDRNQNARLAGNVIKSDKPIGKKGSEDGDTSSLACPIDIPSCGGNGGDACLD
ncbi:MAG TPA: hypothetical protein VF571_02510 [Pyrinomonadaceae bacterium]|jgi:hypothetical protein